MIKHTIYFSKPIKKNESECTYKLSSLVIIPCEQNLLKRIRKFCDGYTRTVKCTLKGNNLYINIITNSSCSISDFPNELKGVRIAESKAKYKLYEVLKSLSTEISNYYRELSINYDLGIARYWRLKDNEFNHIKELDSK